MEHLTTLSASWASASASASAGIEPRVAMNKRRKLRSACDRCHSQKLRCIKKEGEREDGGSCERCLKLRTVCRFGLRAPRGSSLLRRLQDAGVGNEGAQDGFHEQQVPSSVSSFLTQNLPSASAIINGSGDRSGEWRFSPDADAGIIEGRVIAMQPGVCHQPTRPNELADTGTFGHDLYPCEPVDLNLPDQYSLFDVDVHEQLYDDAFPSPSTSNDHSRGDISGEESVASPATTVRNLANLNVALFDCAANLPSMTDVGIDGAGIPSHGSRSRQRKLFAIDELFRLTSEFISVSSGLQVDEGTMLVVMSCLHRLTEIYLSIFNMIQACIKHSMRPQGENEWAIVLPQLQVGSHATPPMQVDANTSLPSTTSSMYMVMIIMLSSQLCEKLASTIAVGDDGASHGSDGVHLRGHSSVGANDGYALPFQHLFTSAISDRMERLRNTIDCTKNLLHCCSGVPE